MDEETLNTLFAGVEYDLMQNKVREKAMQFATQALQSNLIDKFEAHVLKNPKKPFVIFDGLIYTYEAIDSLACKVANVARTWNLKVKPYDCVAIMMLNEPSFIYTFLGLQKLGIPVALINTNLTGQSLIHSVTSVECKALIVGADDKLLAAVKYILPELENLPVYADGAGRHALPPGFQSFDDLMRDTSLGAPAPSLRAGVTLTNICCYIYTSGTTGNPKPVNISHMKTAIMCCSLPATLDLGEDDTVYLVVPLYHTTGFLLGLGGALLKGCTVLLRNKFSAQHFWSDCRTYNVTIVPYIGEMLRYLLSQPKSDLDGVHKIRGLLGNGLRADIWEEVVERFKLVNICEIYGQTEGITGTVNTFGKPGCIGRLSPLLSRLDPNNLSLVKFDPDTAVPVRNANGRCIRVQIGEPGVLISKIPDHLLNQKLYKAGSDATEKKLVRDVFVPGDCYMNSGDALYVDKEYFLYFYDRLGDTFRWKGENVSTKEVANVISSLPFVEDANVYGVTLPGHEGKAGMAAINLTPQNQLSNKELHDLYAHVCRELPTYARPLFVRHIPEAVLTGTFKNQKTKLAADGYDLNKVGDPLYFIDHENKTYSTLTKVSLAKFVKSRL